MEMVVPGWGTESMLSTPPLHPQPPPCSRPSTVAEQPLFFPLSLALAIDGSRLWVASHIVIQAGHLAGRDPHGCRRPDATTAVDVVVLLATTNVSLFSSIVDSSGSCELVPMKFIDKAVE